MNKTDVIEFFDRLAPQWDTDMVRNDDIINYILDNAGVMAGKDILDVACGTGVLIPDYLNRNVSSVTAIDISPKMAQLARGKYPQENVNIICGDVETTEFDQRFDCIIVYNAFPHFPEPQRLVKTLGGLLKSGGMLTIAHGMSRVLLTRHHSGSASNVSIGLISEDELGRIFEPELRVTVKISDDRMYQVTGVRE